MRFDPFISAWVVPVDGIPRGTANTWDRGVEVDIDLCVLAMVDDVTKILNRILPGSVYCFGDRYDFAVWVGRAHLEQR